MTEFTEIGNKILDGVSGQFGWFVATLLVMNGYMAWEMRNIRKRADKQNDDFINRFERLNDESRKDDKDANEKMLQAFVNQAERSAANTHALNNLSHSVGGLGEIYKNLKNAVERNRDRLDQVLDAIKENRNVR